MSITPVFPKWLSAYRKLVTIFLIGIFGVSAVELLHRFAQTSCTAVEGRKVVSLPLSNSHPDRQERFVTAIAMMKLSASLSPGIPTEQSIPRSTLAVAAFNTDKATASGKDRWSAVSAASTIR
jgi:hypothetical protein